MNKHIKKVKKKDAMSLLLLMGFLSLVVIISTANVKSGLVLSEGKQYSINFDATNRLVNDDEFSDGASSVKTVLGTDISFNYGDIKCFEDGWQTLANNGYFANETTINGLNKIIVSTPSNSELTLNFGYEVDGVIDTSFGVAMLNEDNGYSYTFIDSPSYFMITNNSGVDIDINSISLSYTCTTSENPDWLSLKYTKVTGGYCVNGTYDETITKVIIPDTYKGYPIISVADQAFKDNTNIKEVSLGNNISTIGREAFYNTGITSLVLPDSVTKICGSAFYKTPLETFVSGKGLITIESDVFRYCESLKAVTLNDGLKEIGIGVFSYCKSLKEIVVPDSVTSIGYEGFYGCKSLVSAYLGENVTVINNSLFYGCESLSILTISDKVNAIHTHAFLNCYSLSEFKFPSSLTSLSGYNIFGTSNTLDNKLENTDFVLSIPSSLTAITSSIFASTSQGLYKSVNIYISHTSKPSNWSSSWVNTSLANTKITWGQEGPTKEENNFTYYKTAKGAVLMGYTGTDTTVTVPSTLGGVKVIEVKSNFTSTSSIVTLVLPEGLLVINDNAFYNLFTIKNIYIPASVKTMGQNIAYYAYNVKLYMGHEEKDESWPSNWVNSSMKICWGARGIGTSKDNYDYYPIEGGICLTKYTGKDKEVVIPSIIDGYSVLSLAFTDSYSFTKITIPDTVKTIHDKCFYYCSSLANVTIGSGLEYIGIDAFRGRSSLISVTIASESFKVDAYAFYNCSKLTTLNIKSGSMNIVGTYAFYGCALLTGSIVLSNDMTTVPVRTFDGCKALISVTLGNNITTIGNYAFNKCQSLEYTNIPSSVTTIGTYAYYFVDRLGAIFIPSSVSKIDGYAFSISSTSLGLNIFVETATRPTQWSSAWYSNTSSKLVVYWDDQGTNIFKPW